MNVFAGEKNFNPQYLHIQISELYDFLVLNENLCFVEYQPDGMTSNIFNQYYDSPNSFCETRIQNLGFQNAGPMYLIKNAIHYDSSCILAGKYQNIINRSPKKILTILMFPLGVLLSVYIKYKVRKRTNILNTD